MRYSARLLFLSGCLGLATVATAQRRILNDLVLVPEAQLEAAVGESNYVLVGFNHVVFTKGNYSVTGGQLRAGYEHFWNENWSGGATFRALVGSSEGLGDFFGQAGTIIPGALLRHRAPIGKFSFGQRLGVEYGIGGGTANTVEGNGRGLVRLRLDAERSFPLGDVLALRPRLAYEAAAYLRLQRAEDESKERVIDFGNLRAEVGVQLTRKLDITPWMAAQTMYTNTLGQFDQMGNEIGGGRTNFVLPTLGLDVRLTLGRSDKVLWPQLSTQH